MSRETIIDCLTKDGFCVQVDTKEFCLDMLPIASVATGCGVTDAAGGLE